jgi:hypothetical protein
MDWTNGRWSGCGYLKAAGAAYAAPQQGFDTYARDGSGGRRRLTGDIDQRRALAQAASPTSAPAAAPGPAQQMQGGSKQAVSDAPKGGGPTAAQLQPGVQLKEATAAAEPAPEPQGRWGMPLGTACALIDLCIASCEFRPGLGPRLG